MTDEATRALIERMKTDEAFRERVLEVADLDDRLALVQAEGFGVTFEELEAMAGRVNDERLLGVVGAGSADCDQFLCSGYDGCGG